MSDEADAGRSMLSITEAAEATGVHRRDIRRRLDAGEFPNAYTASGPQRRNTWNIPVADLLAAGLRLQTPPTLGNNTASNGEGSDTASTSCERNELDRLRQELDEERTLRRLVEAVAEDRARALANSETVAEDRARALESAQAELAALRARGAKRGTDAPTTRRRWQSR